MIKLKCYYRKNHNFCSALWRKVFNFYASQSAQMNCYFTCEKLSNFYKTCFSTTKETALAPFNLADRVGQNIMGQ